MLFGRLSGFFLSLYVDTSTVCSFPSSSRFTNDLMPENVHPVAVISVLGVKNKWFEFAWPKKAGNPITEDFWIASTHSFFVHSLAQSMYLIQLRSLLHDPSSSLRSGLPIWYVYCMATPRHFGQYLPSDLIFGEAVTQHFCVYQSTTFSSRRFNAWRNDRLASASTFLFNGRMNGFAWPK